MNPYAAPATTSDAHDVVRPVTPEELIKQTILAVTTAGGVFGGSLMILSALFTAFVCNFTITNLMWVPASVTFGGLLGLVIAATSAALLVRLLYKLAGPHPSTDGFIVGGDVLSFGRNCGFLCGGAMCWFLATLSLDATVLFALIGLIPATVGFFVTPVFLRKTSRRADQAIAAI